MVYSIFDTIAVSFSLTITKNRDIFFSCPAKIETFSVAFLVFIFNSARAVDRFSAVLSAFAKSLAWRNICCSSS
jgi:hypothetical protein